MQRVLVWLCCFSGILACDRLHNRVSREVLTCGESVRGIEGPWIKVLDPQGQELPDHEPLDARLLKIDAAGALPPALLVSEKNCVNARHAEALVIRSLAQDRSWSVVVHASALGDPAVTRLQDSSRQTARLRCPVPWIHQGRFLLPLEINPGTRLEALALAPELIGPEGRHAPQIPSLQSSATTLIWPQDWPDGEGRLTLRQQNLLQRPGSALANMEESCPMVVDRQNPQLQLTPAPVDAAALTIQPGSLLRLQIVDANPATIQWCLEPADQSLCLQAEAWQLAGGEVSLPMPAQGRWRLQARASDAAGNSSEPLQQTIEVVQKDLIHTIAARVDQALAEKNERSWEAGLSLLRALVDYRRLILPSEQEQVKNKLIDGILSVSPALQEHQRQPLNGSPRRVWTLNASAESPWLVLTAQELSLWSMQGRLLHKISVPDALTADWSPSQQALALGSADELLVLRLQNSEILEPIRLRWQDQSIFGVPSDVKWIPGRTQMVAAIRGDLPAIVELKGSTLQMRQRLDLKNTVRLAIASDASTLAGTNLDELAIWRPAAEGWGAGVVEELPVKDLQFTRASEKVVSRLLVLLRDGRLVSWSPGLLWKEIDKGVPGEEPTDRPNGRELAQVQPWADGMSGLMERGRRFYVWSQAPEKTLQSVQFSGFDWDQLQNWKVDPCQKAVWLQDNRSLSFWEWQDGTPTVLVKRGEWRTGTDQPLEFQVHCQSSLPRFVSLDARHLRFWSQRGPLPFMRGDSMETVVSTFPDQDALFTAGFDGAIRLWDEQGKNLQQWDGHTAQITELRFLPDWQLYASSAEDGTTRLWTRAGQSAGILSLKDKPQALWRDGMITFNKDLGMSAGRGVLALWSRHSNRTELTITIDLAAGERSGPNSLTRLAGSPRILARMAKGGSWRGLIIKPDGSFQSQEPGLPPLQKLRWLEASRDGERLALRDADTMIRIFRQVDGGWQEETFGGHGLTSFTFAPDGQSFAALGTDNNLLLGEWSGDRWRIIQDKPLDSSSGLQAGLHWTSDAKRVVYAQAGQVIVRDRALKVLHRFQAFPDENNITSLGIHPDGTRLAVGAGPWVRLVDFDLDYLQTQLCLWLAAYGETPEAPADIAQLCAKPG